MNIVSPAGTYFVNSATDVAWFTSSLFTVATQSQFNLPASFGSTVTLAGNPAAPLQAVPLQYLQANYLPLVGGVLSGGLSFGARLATSATDVTKHLMLYDGGATNRFGFNVYYDGVPGDSAHLDYVVIQNADHQFWVNNLLISTISNLGLTMGSNVDITLSRDPQAALQAATRQYVDARNPAGKYVLITGDTMEGVLQMGGYQLGTLRHPMQVDDAATKAYVDLISAASYQGQWHVAANNPNLTTAAPSNANAWEWYAKLVNPAVPETAPAGIPGIAGEMIHEGDRIIWSVVENQYDIYSGGVLDRSTADALYMFKTGDTMFGPLTMSTAGGIGFMNVLANNPSDLSKHILLWGPGNGFSVTPSRLNIVGGVNVSSATYFVNNNLDVAYINYYGLQMLNGTNLWLTGDPTSDYMACTKKYADAIKLLLNNYLLLTGGTMVGPIAMSGKVPIYFFNASQFIRGGDTDAAALDASLLLLGSWDGIGLQNTCPGMPIPVGLNGIMADTRNGGLQVYGNLNVKAATYLHTLALTANGTDFYLNAAGSYASFVGIVTAGAGIAVNDRFYDNYGGIYTVTAVNAGAATAVRIDVPAVVFGAPPSGNTALKAAPGFTGSGLAVALGWTTVNRLNMPSNAIFGGSVTLNRDPTSALEAVTKQYDDRNRGRNIVDVTSGAVTLTVDQADWAYLYVYGSPAGPATITMPVATTVRLLWTVNNTTGQPVTIRGTGGGTIIIPTLGSQAVWTDATGIYPLYNAGQTRPLHDSTTFWATTAFVQGGYLALDGGIETGHVSFRGGIDFGSQVSPGQVPWDTTNHLALWGTGANAYGFSITGNTLNYNAVGTTSKHDFYTGSTLTLSVGTAGTIATYLPLVVNGNATINGSLYAQQNLQVGSATGMYNKVIVQAAPGGGPGFTLYSGNSGRWIFGLDANAEDTADNGGNLAFYRYGYGGTANDGAFLGTVLSITRKDGTANFYNNVTISGSATIGGATITGMAPLSTPV